jgi:hypothetical protein
MFEIRIYGGQPGCFVVQTRCGAVNKNQKNEYMPVKTALKFCPYQHDILRPDRNHFSELNDEPIKILEHLKSYLLLLTEVWVVTS